MTRFLKLILVYVGLLVTAVVGGFLGAELGIWVAVVWNVVVIGSLLTWSFRRAIAREKLAKEKLLGGYGQNE